MSDVLTPRVIVKAVLAMRDAQPRPAVRYVHPSDKQHGDEHGWPQDCSRCLRILSTPAWR